MASIQALSVAFSSMDLLNALNAITVPASIFVVAAASFKIGEATLKRYQYQIASKQTMQIVNTEHWTLLLPHQRK